MPIATNRANASGLLTIQDNSAPGAYKFYRASEK